MIVFAFTNQTKVVNDSCLALTLSYPFNVGFCIITLLDVYFLSLLIISKIYLMESFSF